MSLLLSCREILSFEGFRSPWYKQLLFVVLGLCTGGLLFLIAKWSLTVRTVLRLERCMLKDAQYVRTTVRCQHITPQEQFHLVHPQHHGCLV